MSSYQEAQILLSPEMSRDLYGIHRSVLEMTDADPEVRYTPLRRTREGEMVVLLRAPTCSGEASYGIRYHENVLHNGEKLLLQCGVRLVKRSDAGEKMPSVEEAEKKWRDALQAGGFAVEEVLMKQSAMSFLYKTKQNLRLPFWAVTSKVEVSDAEKAAQTMVRGVGRSRGLGFGMLAVWDK